MREIMFVREAELYLMVARTKATQLLYIIVNCIVYELAMNSMSRNIN